MSDRALVEPHRIIGVGSVNTAQCRDAAMVSQTGGGVDADGHEVQPGQSQILFRLA